MIYNPFDIRAELLQEVLDRLRDGAPDTAVLMSLDDGGSPSRVLRATKQDGMVRFFVYDGRDLADLIARRNARPNPEE